MGIASVSKIMFVDKIIATSSGIWQIQVLIAVSQVNLSLGQKMKTFRVLLTLVLRGDSGGRIRSSRRKHLCWRKTSLRRSPWRSKRSCSLQVCSNWRQFFSKDTINIFCCRMLGYQYAQATVQSQFGSVPSTFAMDNVQCTGNETSLLDCPHLTVDDCGSHEGAGVICSNSQNASRI